jgi:hypothetical protein
MINQLLLMQRAGRNKDMPVDSKIPTLITVARDSFRPESSQSEPNDGQRLRLPVDLDRMEGTVLVPLAEQNITHYSPFSVSLRSALSLLMVILYSDLEVNMRSGDERRQHQGHS